MTSKEIQDTKPGDQSANAWLEEIALQLALANEKQPKVPYVPLKAHK